MSATKDPRKSKPLPLSRFKVLDLTLARAGPTCVRHLADWGAEVIRIEPPAQGEGGDATGGKRHGSDFQNLHRNKRGMTINLKSKSGHALFMEMAKDADVIVENMRSTVKFKLGVDYETVRKINPRIVYGSISGFGQDGPYAARAGVDQIAQGMGGLMSVTGLPGQGPVRVGIPIADLCAGGYLAQAILMALLEREQTGEGQWVSTSLLEAMIAMLDFQASRWTMSGEIPGQAGNDHPTAIPTGVFDTSDGQINIAASGERLFSRCCDALGLSEIPNDPRFRANADRSKNRAILREIILEKTRTRTSAEWITVMDEAGVPCGPINTIDKTFADPQVVHLGMSKSTPHPHLGDISIVAHPVNMSDHSRDIRMAAPDAGQHTDEILKSMGMSAEKIAELRAEGAI